LTKLQKGLAATKQNNSLVANMLALELNIAGSDRGNLPGSATAGYLGDLLINNGGTWDGMSIRDFATAVGHLMTVWNFVPQATYTEANDLASAINAALNATDNPSVSIWNSTGNVVLAGVATAQSTGFLKVPIAPTPVVRHDIFAEPIPTKYAVYQNYPNPFNPTTNIAFDLPQQSTVTLKVYNMLGQEVATILNHEAMDAGANEINFDATRFSSGVYFYRIVAQGVNAETGALDGMTFTSVKKMVLVK
jgi:hypothetical protein